MIEHLEQILATEADERERRDIQRIRNPKLDELLIQWRDGDFGDFNASPRQELEKLVGAKESKKFLRDVIDDHHRECFAKGRTLERKLEQLERLAKR